MAVTISNGAITVVLSGGDPPTSIPTGATLNGTDQKLSDGSLLHPSTGVTPSAITITGTLRRVDAGGSPYEKIDQLESLLYARTVATLAWGRYSYQVLLTDIKPVHKAFNEVDYTLTFFRGVSGAFTSQTQVDLAARAEAALDRLTTLAPRVGPRTSSQQQAVQAARIARETAHGSGHQRAL